MNEMLINELSKTIRSEQENLKLSSKELEKVISEKVQEYLLKNRVKNYNYIERLNLEKNIYYSIRGLGLIDRILEIDNVNEIMINGYEKIYYEVGGVIKHYPTGFSSKESLYELIERIANDSSRSINLANPIMDAKLKNGARVNAVLPPIAIDGPVVTIRVFDKEMMTIEQAIATETITKEAAEFLKQLVKAKYNILISGGTSSGKTTFLNILSNFVPKTERLITIEDNAELRIENVENIVRLEARSHKDKNLEVTIRDLIKASLRMRPDRIIVGEVRGIEAIDMLQAMNTGHDGSFSTGHANSSYDMFNRLEMMIMSDENNYSLEFVQSQIASAIDVVIHLAKNHRMERKVVEISELIGYEDGKVELNPLFMQSKKGAGANLIRMNDLVNMSKLERIDFEIL